MTQAPRETTAVKQLAALALSLALASASSLSHAQSSCSSDQRPRSTALLERFINADCADCWLDPATPVAPRGSLALDWVLPGAKADDAPLSSVATRDALTRLQALGRVPSAGLWHQSKPVTVKRRASAYQLRVAHGMAFNGYVGVSIELKPLPAQSPARADGPWTAWLALIEQVPAGTEGSPVNRQLVRKLLVVPWSTQQAGGLERRSMALPEGSNPQRISLIGWVEDSSGRVQVAAQSRCAAP